MKVKKYISLLLFSLFLFNLIPFESNLSTVMPNHPKSASNIAFIHLTAGNYTSAIGTIFSSGSGTSSDPYIIKDYVIDCEGRDFGIRIENLVNIYLEIRNCTIFNSSSNGIFFYGYSNGTIINNTIYDCDINAVRFYNGKNNRVINNFMFNNNNGITTGSSENLTVSNNTILYSYYAGLYIDGAYNCNFTDNFVSNCSNHLVWIISSAHDNVLRNNTFKNADYYLFRFYPAHNNTLVNNTFIGGNDFGIYLYQSHGNIIENNSFSNYGNNAINGYQSNGSKILNNNFNSSINPNLYHVFLQESNYSIIHRNNFGMNNSYGIYLDKSSYSNFTENYISNATSAGLKLYNSKYCDLSNNTILNSQQGIYTYDSSFLNVSKNFIQNSSTYGIQMGNSVGKSTENCTVQENRVLNTLSPGSSYGMKIKNFNNGTFQSNEITDSAGYGVLFSSTNNASISNNTILRTLNDALSFISDCHSNQLENNTILNNSRGIYLYTSNFNKIRNNTISGASIYGIYLVEFSTWNNITFNTVMYNYQGIYLQNSDNNEIGINKLKNNSNGPYSESLESDDNWIHDNDMYYPYVSFNANWSNIVVGQSVAFDSSACQGDLPLYYVWKYNDTTSTDTIANPIHQFVSAGLFNVSLTLYDAQFELATFIYQILVNPDLLPNANFSMSSNLTYVGRQVTFTNTTQTGNPALSLEWDFGDGSVNQTGSVVTHSYNLAGNYSVTLKVCDFNGDISYRVESITILPNSFPDVSFTVNSTLILVNDSVLFIDNSYAGESPSTWQWNFGDSETNTTVQQKTDMIHKYETAGNFTVICTIIDTEGDSDSFSRMIQVETDTQPNARFQLPKYQYSINETINFSVPSQEGNGPLEYQWNFGDASVNSTLLDPVYFYSYSGNYTVTLTVIDRDGDLATYSVVITIKDPQENSGNDSDLVDPGLISSVLGSSWFYYVLVFFLSLGTFMGISSYRRRPKVVKKPKNGKGKNFEPTVDNNNNIDFNF